MTQVKITPVADHIVVIPDTVESTIAGLKLPDTVISREKPMTGKVLAVGNGRINEPMTVKQGDKVLFRKHAGHQLEVEGQDCIILRETDIYAIINNQI